jgi:protein required for attachment to host cells
MKDTWIVVANSERARVFTVAEEKDRRRLQEVKELVHPASRGHERDLVANGSDRTFNSEGPGRHARSESISPKEHEAWKLCKELAGELESARTNDRFRELIVVAAPEFLGQLRKSMTPPTARLIARELDKDVAHLKTVAIEKHLPADIMG